MTKFRGPAFAECCDVKSFLFTSEIIERINLKISEIMPARCVAANCGNVKDVSRNISLHIIPYFGDTRPEAMKRRKKWVDWIKLKRAKWEPSRHSHLCSVHFKDTDFVRQFGSEVSLTNRFLSRDEIDVCVFPCFHSGAGKEKPLSERDRRMVRKIFPLKRIVIICPLSLSLF